MHSFSRLGRRRAVPVIITACILFLTVFSLMFMMGEASPYANTDWFRSKECKDGVKNHASWINYTSVTGFFLQDDPSTNASTFDYSKVNLGLINRTYPTDSSFDPHGNKTQWARFAHYVKNLNKQASKNVEYKLIYAGRHGEGYHNVAEAFYGTPAWNCYWSELEGNGTITWADAHITPLGVQQAQVATASWANALANAGIPAPETYYTSPLARCLETAKVTFANLTLPKNKAFIPVVKELLRESIGLHTCDRRSSKTWIHQNYPTYQFEQGFAETDPLWQPDTRESDSAQQARLKALLDDVFTSDDNTFISFTSHSGSIGAALRAIGHRTFSLATGAVIPLFIKAETLGGAAPSSSVAPYSTGTPTCTSNPTASATA